MLVLTIALLVFMYIVKIWFPEQFVMAIENKQIVKIGEYIDSNKWLYCVVYLVLGIISDYLYFGAICKTPRLKWQLITTMLIYNISFSCVYSFVDIATIDNFSYLIIGLSSIYMLLVPIFFTKELFPVSITYCTNAVSQLLSLSIRNMPLLLITNNILTTTLMSLECYFWLLLCFIIFNIKEKENKTMGIVKPFYGKSKFYAKKKAKAEKKIAKLQEIIKVCDEKLAEENK